ncbi:hypothetical protein BGW36DRAFT_389346 [Talaromyces proteolyticus]|uniref:Diaminohydroxyphosphoribosylamino-pyrimidine deaminase n=1 Tax=Talaromyces proteolyticus TaxID=1131652 RepID=A0AAD4PV29_9EURO|nr:uncharacterized protein BGW36DRAFT_389346 [Talaromyces proteolyticus]KAH8690804.1 hypothetical protein BGW36DRAFT_389346 [Talaromyces proteolyticus]
MRAFLSSLGEHIVDAEEESFLLFSRSIPSANLGFLDSHAASVTLTIHAHDLTIHQSPTLLSSSRAGGTTGAVLWKITPRFAEWISGSSNPLWTESILSPTASVVELGCGISAVVALALAPRVGHFLATDQEYVRRKFRENIDENWPEVKPGRSAGGRRVKGASGGKSRGGNGSGSGSGDGVNITFAPLDWERDEPATLKQLIPNADTAADAGFDVLVSCDCVYNEALVPSFVRTCAEICRLRPVQNDSGNEDGGVRLRPTVCVIAQQQRSPDVFEAWLREAMRVFDVWRLSDEVLGDGLKDGTGYVVHALLLKG